MECSLTSLSVLDDPVVEGNEVFEMLLESYNGSRVVVTNSRNVVESRRLIIQDNDCESCDCHVMIVSCGDTLCPVILSSEKFKCYCARNACMQRKLT